MTMTPGSARPSPELALLLRAALGSKRVASEAWHAWCGRVSFDDMGEAAMRLMPLVSKNLCDHGIEHELTARIRGIHRYWWSRNQRLLHRFVKVVDQLTAESIEVLVLKGVPLALSYYPDPGLRPMSDFDLLVSTADADRALALLLESGWKPTERIEFKMPERTIDTDVNPGIGLVDVEYQECDLHWHALHDCCFEGADEPFWRYRDTFVLHERRLAAPSATDLLLHVCVHGAVFNPLPPVRWIADVAMIVRHAGARVDWDRLIAQADERLLLVVMREAINIVTEHVELPIPAGVLSRLRNARVSRAEEREYALRQVDKGYLRTITGRWCQLHRRYPHVGSLARLSKIPEFLQQIWSLPSKWAIPGNLMLRVLPAYTRRVLKGDVVEAHPHAVAK